MMMMMTMMTTTTTTRVGAAVLRKNRLYPSLLLPLLRHHSFRRPPPICTGSDSSIIRPFSSDVQNSATTTTTGTGTLAFSTTTSTTTPSTISTTPSTTATWKVAIVGSGPSGCYTAKYLQQAFEHLNNNNKTNDTNRNNNMHIDILERLPTPYGLVRNGVAPDHPEVKNVQNDFDTQLFGTTNDDNDDNLSSSSVSNSIIQFWGNVHVGKDISLDELRQRYDIVVLAFGCESDRSLQIPNYDTLDGIISAKQFVHWYNGHPDYDYIGPIIQNALYGSGGGGGRRQSVSNGDNISSNNNIVVIGHGNVALDCARILVKTFTELDETDITTRALDVLWGERTRRTDINSSNNNDGVDDHDGTTTTPTIRRRMVSIVGRRGHIQAAFTIKEVRELTKLPETSNGTFRVFQSELQAGKTTIASQDELKSSKPKQRVDTLLTQHAVINNDDDDDNNVVVGTGCRVDLRFLLNPIRFEPKRNNDDDDYDDNNDDDMEGKTTTTTTTGRRRRRLGAVVCERTQLVGEVGNQSAIGTGIEETFDADLCLVSIGYKGIPIVGTEQYYDESRGILRNVHGVVDNDVDIIEHHHNHNDDNDQHQTYYYQLAPLYVSGWLKRGPSGIIGTNIADAKDTVASIMNDIQDGTKNNNNNNIISPKPSPTVPLRELLEGRGVQIVDWVAYQRINDVETSEGYKRNPKQPREKIVHLEDLLRVARAGSYRHK